MSPCRLGHARSLDAATQSHLGSLFWQNAIGCQETAQPFSCFLVFIRLEGPPWALPHTFLHLIGLQVESCLDVVVLCG